jgi:hypothetical protein
MKRQRVWFCVLVVTTLATAGIPGAAEHSAQPSRQAPAEVRLTGEVTEIHAARVFTVRERGDGRELLVLAPRPLRPGFVGATVTVVGTLRRLSDVEIRRDIGLGELTGRTRDRFVRGPVLVAHSVLAIGKGEPAPVAEDLPAPAVETAPPQPIARRTAREDEPVTLRTAMLVANLDVFAGREVRLLQGHVVGVLEPGAFLIEPETSYWKPMGQRDRVLVLTSPAGLRVPEDLFVGTTVTVTGVARTLLGVQVTREVAWPAKLQPELAERLEVRAAVLARSVQMLDGTELTDRPGAATGR